MLIPTQLPIGEVVDMKEGGKVAMVAGTEVDTEVDMEAMEVDMEAMEVTEEDVKVDVKEEAGAEDKT